MTERYRNGFTPEKEKYLPKLYKIAERSVPITRYLFREIFNENISAELIRKIVKRRNFKLSPPGGRRHGILEKKIEKVIPRLKELDLKPFNISDLIEGGFVQRYERRYLFAEKNNPQGSPTIVATFPRRRFR